MLFDFVESIAAMTLFNHGAGTLAGKAIWTKNVKNSPNWPTASPTRAWR
ncbi:hypothetical protein QNM99_20480 [Pseudomonas sp. PCH446]